MPSRSLPSHNRVDFPTSMGTLSASMAASRQSASYTRTVTSAGFLSSRSRASFSPSDGLNAVLDNTTLPTIFGSPAGKTSSASPAWTSMPWYSVNTKKLAITANFCTEFLIVFDTLGSISSLHPGMLHPFRCPRDRIVVRLSTPGP